MDGEISKMEIREFELLADNMARLLQRMRRTCPGANMYLEGEGTWYLLSGDSHDQEGKARLDRVVTLARVQGSSGGAW